MSPPLTPPIKCQGIKTKLVKEIAALSTQLTTGRWIEPFCGSCVVPLNIQPRKALLCDSNIHIIQFYNDIKNKKITPTSVKKFLIENGEKLRIEGEDHFYKVRERFNSDPTSYDFLFLNRSCFNGVMRFNRSGKFNVPFCRKPERFSPAYITKIVNQIHTISKVIDASDWEFKVADFRWTLSEARQDDFVYADPPYAGRHVDYFNSWTEQDETDFSKLMSALPCNFILSTWHSNKYRANELLKKNWDSSRFHIYTHAHHYHVGASEELRHPMIEALITNYASPSEKAQIEVTQESLFAE